VPTATFVAATSTVTRTAAADGSATITGTIPSNATANIGATITDGANTATATIPVTLAATTTTTTTSTTSTSGLATTGTYISLATVWGAVGLVALGGGFVMVRQLNRKREGAPENAQV